MFWFLGFSSLPGAQLWNDESDPYLRDIVCSLDSGHNSATRRWAPAVFREETSADTALNPIFDALFSARSSFVFRNKVFAEFEKENLTGWIRNPASIHRADSTVETGFGELWIKGFAGIANQKGGCRLLWKCRTCGNTRYAPGFSVADAFKNLDWDGSDFFTLWPLVNYRFCTDRAKAVLERFHTEEIRFINAEELTKPLRIYGDAPIPPFYSTDAKRQIEQFWASAPPAPHSGN